MKTILLEQPEQLRLLDAKPPEEPGPGEALVRVGHVGVCGTDLHAFKGKQPFFDYPRILGHELGVEVLAFGGTAFVALPAAWILLQSAAGAREVRPLSGR